MFIYVCYCLETVRFYPEYGLSYNKFYVIFSCTVSCEFFKISGKFFLPCCCKSCQNSQTYRALSLSSVRLKSRLDLLPLIQVMLNIWMSIFTFVRISNLANFWLIVINICLSQHHTYFYVIHKHRALQKMKLHPETKRYLKRSILLKTCLSLGNILTYIQVGR